jgi:hypothetical protein
MTEADIAPDAPVVGVSVCPSPNAPGMYEVEFHWVPSSDIPVDHYRVILTEHPIIVTPRREHWAEVRNVSGWLSWPVHPGNGLWVTVTAVGADGSRSDPSQLGVDAVAC